MCFYKYLSHIFTVCTLKLVFIVGGANFGLGIYLAIVNTDFCSFFFLRSLLFTHFEDTQEAYFLWASYFDPTRVYSSFKRDHSPSHTCMVKISLEFILYRMQLCQSTLLSWSCKTSLKLSKKISKKAAYFS